MMTIAKHTRRPRSGVALLASLLFGCAGYALLPTTAAYGMGCADLNTCSAGNSGDFPNAPENGPNGTTSPSNPDGYPSLGGASTNPANYTPQQWWSAGYYAGYMDGRNGCFQGSCNDPSNVSLWDPKQSTNPPYTNGYKSGIWAGSKRKGAPLPMGTMTGVSPSPVRANNFRVVSSGPIAEPAHSQVYGSVTCPAGEAPLSGGATGSSFRADQAINSSGPETNGWFVYMNNPSAASYQFWVKAVCTTVSQSTVQSSSWSDNAPDTQVTGSAACPSGQVPTGGGGTGSSISPDQALISSGPTADGWAVDMSNPSPVNDYTFRTQVVCANVAEEVIDSPTWFDDPAGAQASGFANCPTGELPVGGGPVGGSTTSDQDVNTSGPTSSGWAVHMNNKGQRDHWFFVQVLCAQ